MGVTSRTWLLTPGLVEYRSAWEAQRELAAARAAGLVPDCFILLQHPHTFTLGRRADPANVLADEETLTRLGIEVVAIDRGGDVTYHGPGQWVGYPILDITPRGGDVLRYLHDLEDVLVLALCEFGIEARPGRELALTGAWVGDDKIAAIGVKVRGGITQHGFALNVATDLRFFELIVPCGIRDKGVTSIEKVLGRPVPMDAAARALQRAFSQVFDARLEPVAWDEALARARGGRRPADAEAPGSARAQAPAAERGADSIA
ncbi:MAG: lipoyl(octanoyl) transferase LipB [Clostridia bacterium]|nr:lipoyl(octanoyl) transferase LipB [Clostridia bacterium]